MSRAGYILAGGASSRMGRDKALLPYRGVPLAAHIAAMVRHAAGSVTLVGDPARYAQLGLAVIPDVVPGCGPLGGIHTALLDTAADWNLIVACDMPEVTAPLLAALLEGAERAGSEGFVPAGPGGRLEPLCAVYHRRAAAHIGSALARGVRKVREAIAGLDLTVRSWDDGGGFQNCNTPGEWAAYSKTREKEI